LRAFAVTVDNRDQFLTAILSSSDPFFLASSGQAALVFFLTERMRLSLSFHPQNSVIPLVANKYSAGQVCPEVQWQFDAVFDPDSLSALL
jgi:hypothetical protein